MKKLILLLLLTTGLLTACKQDTVKEYRITFITGESQVVRIKSYNDSGYLHDGCFKVDGYTYYCGVRSFEKIE